MHAAPNAAVHAEATEEVTEEAPAKEETTTEEEVTEEAPATEETTTEEEVSALLNKIRSFAAEQASENAKLHAAINAAILAVEDVLEEDASEVVEVTATEEETIEIIVETETK